MKLWIDDVRTPPDDGYIWCKSVNEAIATINKTDDISLIDIDHDAGDYVCDGGDYIKVLDYLEMHGYSYPIRIHSMNPVGVMNMRAIIRKNNWVEVF